MILLVPGGVAFKARDQQCAAATHDTLPWVEQEETLRQDKMIARLAWGGMSASL